MVTKVIVIRYRAIYVGCHDSTEVMPELCKALHNHSFSCCKISFGDNLLNNKTIVVFNLAEYLLILANLAYGLVGKYQILKDIKTPVLML